MTPGLAPAGACPSSRSAANPSSSRAPGNPKHPNAVCLHPLSSPELLVTNLRLLDLDLLDDWPQITEHTFITKDAAQNQSKRINCVEWALYRLFEIWDHRLTAEKLSPFFPPLEPLQSLNLRAALYRCLNELKKDGVLGRETVLRKTMLDECKGEKFVEILVTFSTAVLRKELSRAGPPSRPSLAYRYATASKLPSGSQASLLPLAIAHKKELMRILKEKENQKRRYREFGNLLQAKAYEALDRNQQCGETLDSLENAGKEFAAPETKKVLQENWLGNPEWLDIMVHGDQLETDDPLFQVPFEDIWLKVQQGREIEEPAGRQKNLLQDLETRVNAQEERLSRWKSLHAKVLSSRGKESSTTPKKSQSKDPTPMFAFNAHQGLQIGQPVPAPSEEDDAFFPPPTEISGAYGSILGDLRDQLAQVSRPKPVRRAPPRLPVNARQQSNVPTKAALQSRSRSQQQPKLSESDEDPSPAGFERAESPDWAAPLGKSRSQSRSEGARTVNASRQQLPSEDDDDVHKQYIRQQDSPSPSASPSRALQLPTSPPMSSSPLDPRDEQVEQILGQMANASPSPLKNYPQQFDAQPSLSERTRLTMESYSPSPTKCKLSTRAKPSKSNPPLPTEDEDEDPLILRTRQTMLAMAARVPQASPSPPLSRKNSAATNGHRKSISIEANTSRRKSRSRASSLLPVNPWEDEKESRRRVSPMFQEWAAASEQQTTPSEELFKDGIDETSVFKSRPKIKASPVMAPAADEEDDLDGIEDGYGDGLESSPLAGRGR
ncbi:HAUS augmin-like complex subunit 6 N-terminus-domain-containing protein [Phyllosticta citriasiana]|uniref:HAUS augmin-like complex subunit 6 N-terminus-domain-containing protein n=1 Tax=Phyllosticta citriasiana TaxID=595635 RepID=A0ABR1KX08_9PEZI